MWLTLVAAAGPPAAAAVAFRPVEPADGAVVGRRILFRAVCGEPGACDLSRARLRIDLVDGASGERLERWNRRTKSTGWAEGEQDEVVYAPRRPLVDGRYLWRVWTWSGTEWIGGEQAPAFRVDGVAPAPVQRLELGLDRDTETVVARWAPVADDLDGGAEIVARYRVYAFADPRSFRPAARFEMAAVTGASARLPLGDLDGAPLVFLVVQAQDEAGNEAGRH